MAGWHHHLNRPSLSKQREAARTGKPGCCGPWGCKELATNEGLRKPGQATSKEGQRILKPGPPRMGQPTDQALALTRSSGTPFLEIGEMDSRVHMAVWVKSGRWAKWDDKCNRVRKADPENYLMVHHLGNCDELSVSQHQWKICLTKFTTLSSSCTLD